jgi:hypothetical protein
MRAVTAVADEQAERTRWADMRWVDTQWPVTAVVVDINMLETSN